MRPEQNLGRSKGMALIYIFKQCNLESCACAGDPIAEQEDEEEEQRLQEAAPAEPELKRQATKGNRVPVAAHAAPAAGGRKQAEDQKGAQKRVREAAAGPEAEREAGGGAGVPIEAYAVPIRGGGFQQGAGTEAEHTAAAAAAEAGSMPVAAYVQRASGSKQQVGRAAAAGEGAAGPLEAAAVKQEAAAAATAGPEPERPAIPAAASVPVAAYAAHGGSRVKKESAMEAEQGHAAGAVLQQEAAAVKPAVKPAPQKAATVQQAAAAARAAPKHTEVEGTKVAAFAAAGGYEPANVIEEGRIYFVYRRAFSLDLAIAGLHRGAVVQVACKLSCQTWDIILAHSPARRSHTLSSQCRRCYARRPRVNTEHPHSLQDVQRCALLLLSLHTSNAWCRSHWHACECRLPQSVLQAVHET